VDSVHLMTLPSMASPAGLCRAPESRERPAPAPDDGVGASAERHGARRRRVSHDKVGGRECKDCVLPLLDRAAGSTGGGGNVGNMVTA
jgi:hypothetical protein